MKKISTQLTILTLLSFSLLGLVTVGDLSAADEYNVEGRYKRISPARPLEQTDKVEVVDVFWYGCSHCYHFLPLIEQWGEGKPDYVDFKRLPAIFADSWEVHARAYYTARVLGVDDKVHVQIFNAIHGEKRSLNNKQEMMVFFAEHGVDSEDFATAYDSFSVDALTRESQVMPRRWGVQGTPSVIVNGRYLISGSLAGSYPEMIKVLQVLVEQEHSTMTEGEELSD